MDFQCTKYKKMKQPTSTLLKKTNAQLPDHLNDLELIELVETYQVHSYSRTCCKYNRNECRFFYGYFTEMTIAANTLDSEFKIDEKQEFLIQINTLIS